MPISIRRKQMLSTKSSVFGEACIIRYSNFWARLSTIGHTVRNDENGNPEEVLTKYRIFYSYDTIIGIEILHMNHIIGDSSAWECDTLIRNTECLNEHSSTTGRHLNCMLKMCMSDNRYSAPELVDVSNEEINKWIDENIER